RAPPVIAHAVAVLAVPFLPVDRKIPHAIAAIADVPWLRDQLGRRYHGVLRDRRKKRAAREFAAWTARKRGRKVEAKSIDVHLEYPVAQAFHHHLEHPRMRRIQ